MRFPSWLHIKIPKKSSHLRTLLKKYNLNTVCSSAKCPNRLRCFEKSSMAFLILGKFCTRSCRFCNIPFSKSPPPPDPDEPKKIAVLSKELSLKHVVITMVTRDDLADGGAFHLIKTIKHLKGLSPKPSIEILTSDFSGKKDILDMVLSEEVEIFNHNLETTRALTKKIRCKADYDLSLNILSHAKQKYPQTLVKSGLMVGLGETEDQVKETIKDLKKAGCDIITIGQYLRASLKNIEVDKFIPPSIFEEYKNYGISLGVKEMVSHPFARSSYNLKK